MDESRDVVVGECPFPERRAFIESRSDEQLLGDIRAYERMLPRHDAARGFDARGAARSSRAALGYLYFEAQKRGLRAE